VPALTSSVASESRSTVVISITAAIALSPYNTELLL
jgi:hypothetical protein